jgi:hypothetical protein
LLGAYIKQFGSFISSFNRGFGSKAHNLALCKSLT